MLKKIFSSKVQIIVFCYLIIFCHTAWTTSALESLQSLQSSSIVVLNSDNKILHAKNAEQLFIPASTVKILTALIALEHWGKDYRFSTNFYLEHEANILWVKGFGDPYLISEELDLIVNELKQVGITELDGIGVDISYYENSILIDGKHDSLNPYDAPIGALAANFNTINVRVYPDSISSSEKQTPLTPLAESLAQGLDIGSHRINLGKPGYGPQYFAELLKAKLNRSKIITNFNYLHGSIPKNAMLLFKYKNSRTLEQVISSMLEFSNNYIANQLYLNLGAETYGAPANMKKSSAAMEKYIAQNFDWNDYHLSEGAGLSRMNRLSAMQLIEILEKFKPYRYLMPTQNSHIYAKSGTMKNVSTYAGYLKRDDDWSPFALMINQPVNFSFREKVADELLK